MICVLYTISPDGHAGCKSRYGRTCMTMMNMYENMDLCTIHDRALWARKNSPDLWPKECMKILGQNFTASTWTSVREMGSTSRVFSARQVCPQLWEMHCYLTPRILNLIFALVLPLVKPIVRTPHDDPEVPWFRP